MAFSRSDALTTVVHIITRLELGGAQENTLYTCERLDRGRFRVALAYGPGGQLDARAEAIAELERWPVEALRREIRAGADLAAVTELTRRLRAARQEHQRLGLDPARFVVHTHSSKAGIVGRLAAAAAGVPVIVHGIHGFGFHQGQNPAKFAFYVNAERAAARTTHAFFSVCKANLREARDRKIVQPHHYTAIVRSGMDIDSFASSEQRRDAGRRSLSLAHDDEVILAIANFKPQKDPLTLIRAFAGTARRRPKARLLYAGDGPLRPQVEAEIKEQRLDSRVTLLGWRDDIPDLLAACDLVALSSIFEGLPRSAVQAVAARRPFVGTDVDGTSEIIRSGHNGFLVPPRNPAALADALDLGLIRRPVDPDDQTRVRAWDIGPMVAAQEKAYAELVSPGRH